MDIVNVELSPELKEKLQGYLPITPEGVFKYTPEVFKKLFPPKEWPVFTLKSLTSIETTSEDIYTADKEGYRKISYGKSVINNVRKGVQSWVQYPGLEFTPELKDFEGLKDSTIERLPEALLHELSTAIVNRSSLTDEELLGL